MHLMEEPKTPKERLDYFVDLTDELVPLSDTIDSALWTVPTGLITDGNFLTNTRAYVWLKSGVAGQEYEVGCEVLTTAGRKYERFFRLQIVDKK